MGKMSGMPRKGRPDICHGYEISTSSSHHVLSALQFTRSLSFLGIFIQAKCIESQSPLESASNDEAVRSPQRRASPVCCFFVGQSRFVVVAGSSPSRSKIFAVNRAPLSTRLLMRAETGWPHGQK